MNKKQIALTIERIETTSSIQHFDRKQGDVGQGPWTTQVIDVRYEVVKIRNAAVIKWDDNIVIKVGTSLTETQADSIARCSAFDVTITN